MKEPKSAFVKTRCGKCKNEQIIFNKATTNVACLVCGAELSQSTGGKAKIKGHTLETLQ